MRQSILNVFRFLPVATFVLVSGCAKNDSPKQSDGQGACSREFAEIASGMELSRFRIQAVDWSESVSDVGFEHLELGDVDGDGRVELLGVPVVGRSLALFPFQENGILGSGKDLGISAEVARLGDLDGDGRSDLVFLDPDGSTLKVAFGSPSGTFEEEMVIHSFALPGADERRGILLGDQDADGILDIAAVSGGRTVLLRNSGRRTFSLLWQDQGGATGTGMAFRRRNVEDSGRLDLWMTDPVNGQLISRYTETGGRDGFSSAIGFHRLDVGTDDLKNTRIGTLHLDADGTHDIIVNLSAGFLVLKSDSLGGLQPLQVLSSPHVETMALLGRFRQGNEVILFGASKETGQSVMFELRDGRVASERAFFTGKVTAAALVEGERPQLFLSHANGKLAMLEGRQSGGGLEWALPLIQPLPKGSTNILALEGGDILFSTRGEGKLIQIRGDESTEIPLAGAVYNSFAPTKMPGTVFVFVEGRLGRNLVALVADGLGGYEEVGAIELEGLDELIALSSETAVISSSVGRSLSILQRKEDRSFVVQATYVLPELAPGAMQSIDLDCDERDDLLVLSSEGDEVVVLRGNEHGFDAVEGGISIGFEASGLAAWSTESGNVMLVSDRSSGRIASYRVNGAGSASPAAMLELHDAHDGLLGIWKVERTCAAGRNVWVAAGRDGSVFLGQVREDGSLETFQAVEGKSPHLVPPTFIDLDGDGIDDLVLSQTNGSEAWFTRLFGTCLND